MPRAPGIRQWLPLPYGPFADFLRDPLQFQMRGQKRFGDIFHFRIGPLLIHFLHHPDHVRRVLYDNPKNYQRGWQYRILRRLFGDNLLVSEGDSWLRQRRLAQPAFQRQRLAGYANVMEEATSRMLSDWCARGGSEITVDIGPEMSRLALAIASRTLFDRDVSHEADTVGKEFAVVAQYLEHRFNQPFTTLPLWCPTPSNRRFKEAARTLNELVLALVRERRREGRDHGDLLSMLMSARDEETGASMTDDQLRSEVLTFLMAGHETTATALTWTWYLLATHPTIQQRVRDEVERVLGDRSPTPADLSQLDTTRMVLEESMRLYPPVWAVPRQVVADDEIGGFRVPAGSTVLLCQFLTHRHPEFWEKPEEFHPDRFAPERSAVRPKGAYFPFLGGAHQCIGNEFAMLEMRLIVALVLQKFDLELHPDQEIRPRASIALRPSEPVRLVLRRTT
jgi:cytochrome P450